MPPHESEANLEKIFQHQVRLAGGISYKLAPTTAGIPDRLVMFPGGKMYLVELKTEKGQLSPIQEVLHERLSEEFNVPVYTLYGSRMIAIWIRNRICDGDREMDRGRASAPSPA